MSDAQSLYDSPQMTRLRWGMRISGAVLSVFFAGAALAVILKQNAIIDESSVPLGKLLAWTTGGGNAYLLMLATVYIVWGIYIWLAASDPVKNQLFMDFTIIANIAHPSVMAAMAIVNPTHTMHLLGDVPFGLSVGLILAILWLPVRRQADAISSATH